MTTGSTGRPALPRPRAILFDWDNTLVDVWESIWRSYQVTAEAFGIEAFSYTDTRRRVRRSMRDTFPSMFGERWQEAARLFSDTYASLHLEGLRPLDGAQALIELLARTDIHLGVVSNKQGRFLRAEAAHLGWDRHFHRLVGAGDAERDKPAPGIRCMTRCAAPESRRTATCGSSAMRWLTWSAQKPPGAPASSWCMTALALTRAPAKKRMAGLPIVPLFHTL